MVDFLTDKVFGRVRQFGFGTAIRQAGRAMVRNVHQIDRNIVFIIPNFGGHTFRDPRIVSVTNELIAQAAASGALTAEQSRLLAGFLAEGSRGVCARIDKTLAGYAWVQFSGEYTFGPNARVRVPPGHAIAKNLYVRPEYRGRRLAEALNAARLALIPACHTPVVFIIPENRYAIRNWEKYGMTRVAEVTQSRWFRRPWRTAIRRLAAVSEADPLLGSLKDSNHS